jgi:hypothetical protein
LLFGTCIFVSADRSLMPDPPDFGPNFIKKYLLAAPNYSCYFAGQGIGLFIFSLLFILWPSECGDVGVES